MDPCLSSTPTFRGKRMAPGHHCLTEAHPHQQARKLPIPPSHPGQERASLVPVYTREPERSPPHWTACRRRNTQSVCPKAEWLPCFLHLWFFYLTIQVSSWAAKKEGEKTSFDDAAICRRSEQGHEACLQPVRPQSGLQAKPRFNARSTKYQKKICQDIYSRKCCIIQLQCFFQCSNFNNYYNTTPLDRYTPTGTEMERDSLLKNFSTLKKPLLGWGVEHAAGHLHDKPCTAEYAAHLGVQINPCKYYTPKQYM